MRGFAAASLLLCAACASAPAAGPAAAPGAEPEVPADVRRALEAYNAGLDAAVSGDFAGAVNRYTQALTFDPQFPQAYAARAIAYSRMESWTEAEADYARAIDTGGPRAGRWHYLRARYFHDRQRLREAEADYDAAVEALSRSPDDSLIDLRLHRALLYQDTNRPDRARAEYEAALQLNPDAATAAEIRRWMNQLGGR